MVVLERQSRTISGWPACELLVEAPLKPGAQPSQIAMLMLYANDHFYQIRVFAVEPGTEPMHVRKCYDSVQFIPPRPGSAKEPAP